MNTKKKEHLPLYGVGPLYVYVIAALTLAAVLIRNLPVLEAGRIGGTAKTILTAAGIILILLGVFMWIQAVVVSKVDDSIKKNELVTTGIYAWVRNPIYSAFMILCTGVLLIAGNVWLFVLPFVFWIFLTVLMKRTEEKWLAGLYGKEYEEYCARVNRCWPWFPGKDK